MWHPQDNRRFRGRNSIRVSHIFCEEPPQGVYERVSRAASKVFRALFGRSETQIESIVDTEDDEAPPLERRYARGRWEMRPERKQSRDTATQTELEDRAKRARDDDPPVRSAKPTKRRKRMSPFNRRSAPTKSPPGLFNPQHIERLKTGTCASARFLKKLREVSRPEPSPHESDLSCPNTPEAASPARSASPEIPSTGGRTPVHAATPEYTTPARPETPKNTAETLSPVPLRISPEPAKSPEPTPPVAEPLFIESPVEVEPPKPVEPSLSQSTASDTLVASQTDSMQVSVELRKPEPPQSPQVTLPLASISSPASLASQTSNPFLSPAIAPATQYSFVFGHSSPEKSTSSMFPPPSVGAFASADMAMTPTASASFPSNPFAMSSTQMSPFGQISTPPSMPSFEAPSPAVFNSSAQGQGGGFSLGVLKKRPGSKK